MSEMQDPKLEEQPRLLDVVEIDGEWCQVIGGGNVVRALGSGNSREIDWNGYKLARRIDLAVKDIVRAGERPLTQDEIGKVHWGSEQEEDPSLREEVRVFGIYRRKE